MGLNATNNIHIQEGRATQDFSRSNEFKSHGFLSSRYSLDALEHRENNAISSTLMGDKVALNANDISVVGNNLVSKDLTQINAASNLNIAAAKNYTFDATQHIEKQSGLTASLKEGNASLGYAKSALDTQQQNNQVSLTQSHIGSQNGNVNLIAGKTLTTEAAQLNAGKDLNLIAKDIHLNAGEQTNFQETHQKGKQSGFSMGVTYNPIQAAISTYQKNTKDNPYSDSAVGQIMSQADAIGKTAYTLVILTTKAITKPPQ